MSSDKHSRTERATPQKRDKAREKGQVFRSREVSGAIGFIAAVAAILVLGGRLQRGLMTQMTFFLSGSALTETPLVELTSQAVYRVSSAGLPFLALTLGFSVMGSLAQARPTFTFQPFAPDPNRLFSISKLTNMFSFSGAANLVRGVLGLFALTIAGVTVIAPEVPTIMRLPELEVASLAAWMSGLIVRLLVRAALIFVVIAAIDYALNYRQHEEQLKMTKQEVKEEHKQNEGDPRIKARVRRLQRAAAQKRMMSMVDKATVVITNPTHVAVALLYDVASSPAPRVVAKGKGELAARIRERARKNDVVIYEDPPLARALYGVELDAVIPAELYKAVAEVLAYLVRVSRIRM